VDHETAAPAAARAPHWITKPPRGGSVQRRRQRADLYIAASARENACFIIETHSENFVLRLRRRIAEGLDPARVKLYWINDDTRPGSQVDEILIHENGDVSNWPSSVFSEDFEEVRKIREAQRAKARGGEA